MPRHFTHPPFTHYNGKMDPVERVCLFTQIMALYSQNDWLLYKVFPSSLSPMVMRWFNIMKKGSIHNFSKLIQAFEAKFITCSQEPQPIYVLLSMAMGSGETLQSYLDRYWELYNEIRVDNEHTATSTFKLGLPLHSELRDSLTICRYRIFSSLDSHVEIKTKKTKNKLEKVKNHQFQSQKA